MVNHHTRTPWGEGKYEMDTNKFMQLFASANEVDSDLSETKEALRKVLEDGRHWYCDISGDGTQYLCTGTRHGVGFSQCWITLQPDGMAVVRAVSTPVPEEHVRSMSKLCRSWNKRFMVEGLSVQDNRIVFETTPFDPVGGRFTGDKVVGLALSTVHEYASAILALEAGVEPWDLLTLYDEDHSGGGDDDDGGMPSLDRISELLRSLGSSSDERMSI